VSNETGHNIRFRKWPNRW